MIGASTPLADNLSFELRASGWESALLAPQDTCRASFAFSAWLLLVCGAYWGPVVGVISALFRPASPVGLSRAGILH